MRTRALIDEQRVRDAMSAAEDERGRWARELQDETLQGLGALRILLATARRSDDPDRLEAALGEAVGRIDDEIDRVRGLIRELRPAVLDELGAAAAIEGLASRASEGHGIAVTAVVDLCRQRYPSELETALYRTVQEAVSNAIRHGRAHRVEISVAEADDVLHVSVRDDGRGFNPGAPTDGYGISGMRERIALLPGELEIASSPAGTSVTAWLPNP
jgi:signal transduction histidine kinase